MRKSYVWASVALFLTWTQTVYAEVLAAGDHGFQIKVVRTVKAGVNQVDHAIIHEVADWWDPAHTFSKDAKNLSMDLANRRFHEALPNNGFVTHMEIAHYRPSDTIRLTGGLGPLQEMGVQGALTMRLKANQDATVVTLTYNVTGFSPDGLAKLAPVVDGVLTAQLDRLSAHFDPAD